MRRLFRRKAVGAFSMNYDNEAPMKGS